jgi:hypothetical protein
MISVVTSSPPPGTCARTRTTLSDDKLATLVECKQYYTAASLSSDKHALVERFRRTTQPARMPHVSMPRGGVAVFTAAMPLNISNSAVGTRSLRSASAWRDDADSG